jgi:hypothetical protein
MTIEEKKQELKKHYDKDNFKGFYTDDCESVTQINFDEETVFYYVYVTASCECCSYPEERETDLSHFLQYISDSDFEMILDELKCAKAKAK